MTSDNYVSLHTHSEHCLAPETLVCTADLLWKPISEVEVGEQLVGFDEDFRPPEGQRGMSRSKMRRTTVTHIKRVVKDCYLIKMENGTEIISSAEHGWVVNHITLGSQVAPGGIPYGRNGNCRRWVKTKELFDNQINMRGTTKPHMILWANPWNSKPAVGLEREAAWLAGIADGEGQLHAGQIGFGQNPGLVLDEMYRACKALGYEISSNIQQVKNKPCIRFYLQGYETALRFLAQCRPIRFMDRTDEVWVGRRSGSKFSHPVRIESVEHIGLKETVAITTTTKTFVAEGFLSHNSQLDGFSQVEAIAQRAASLGQSAVALTDHGECSGHIELEKACEKTGVKPIYGMEGYVVDSIEETRANQDRLNSHLCIFAETQEGLKNLWSLSSRAYLEGLYHKPLADWDMLRHFRKGLIVTDGCMLANMARFIVEDKDDEALLWASKYLDVFGEENFFMELHTWQFTDPHTDDQKLLNANMTKTNLGKIDIANRLGIPLIVVNDAHYAAEHEWENHALFWNLSTKQDADRLANGKTAAWIMSSDEIQYWMSMHGVPVSVTEEAIKNTSLIADRCNVEIQRRLHVPVLTKSKDDDLKLFLNNLETGFQQKVVDKGLDAALYMDRAEKECKLIIERELPGYFNIVADYCQEFKNRGWLLAAGRGSSGGSLVAYLDNINELDPVARGLLFERFLNPGRLDYPDIDTDIPKSKRQEAIAYVEEKYGADKVCRIGTFGRLGAKQVLNDLCRVMEIPFADHKAMTKIIEQVETIQDDDVEETDEDASTRTWEEILETQESDLTPWVKKYPLLFLRMQNMIGLIRQSGTHASGVIISDESLIGELPLRKKKDQAMTTQFDMRTIADLGFIKFDLLGVKTLDILMEARELITGKQCDPRFFYDFTDEQYADPAIWEPIGRGETVGVFQVSTPAGTQLCKKIKPQNEYEMAALVAVDRPGVTRAGMTDEYIERRRGLRDITTPHPLMTEILEETYGIVVYQEQVLEIVQRLAGYSLEEADNIRAIVGKKKIEKMLEEKPRFIQRCVDNPDFARLAEGRARQKATQIWDQIEKTGSYAFNKAHAQGYSLLACWGSWLAHYYPVEFLTACLIHRPEKLPEFVREIKRKGFQVLPPDINHSGNRFSIVDGAVRYGLQDLKGVGPGALAEIMEHRPFSSLKNMLDTVNKRLVRKNVVEVLIKIGTMDSLGDRYSLLREYYAMRKEKEFVIPDFQDERVIQQLELEIVGNYITKDPLDQYRPRIDGRCLDDPDKIDSLNEGEIVEIGGVLVRVHEHQAKNGLMAFLDVEWDGKEFPVVCFADSYRENRNLLQAGSPVIIRAIRGKRGVWMHNVIRLDYVRT